MRIAISTGGGDAPGLNAVIRAVVLSAHYRGWRCYGIQRGYEGLLSFKGVVPLGPAADTVLLSEAVIEQAARRLLA